MIRLVYLIAVLVAVLAVIVLILYVLHSTERAVKAYDLGTPLSELRWTGEGTRSYMLEYVPLECEGRCALVRVWLFAPSEAKPCPEKGLIEVLERFCCGGAATKLEGRYRRKGAYCYLGAFAVIARKPLVLKWEDLVVPVTETPRGRLQRSGELLAITTSDLVESFEGWKEEPATGPLRRAFVKPLSEEPYTALVVVEADTEATLTLKSGPYLLRVRPAYAMRDGLYVSGIIVVSGPGRVEVSP